MLFSSITFLFYFLPFVILINFLIKTNKWKNLFLMFSSIVFFAWGETEMVFLLLFSIYVNYVLAIQIDKQEALQKRKWYLILALVFNVGLLCYYKYYNFFTVNVNDFFGTRFKLQHITLPIGISFYTFHNISYVVDVYKRKVAAQKDLVNIALYISFFPQLIAGPIVRYVDIADQLYNRVVTNELFVSGVKRFIIGLGKKVLIGDVLVVVADQIFGLPITEMHFTASWIGIVFLTLQVYYDFSGYSDMAIGMGRMFGFRFLENFNFPYISQSIHELWQRWHISLSSWFRDYVYIPLGGSRVSPVRLYVNLWIVFFLTGFWHGASWNFILWGVFHGIFLIIERIGFGEVLKKLPGIVRNAYTMLVFMLALVIFRTRDIPDSFTYMKAMTNLYRGDSTYFNIHKYIDPYVICVFITALIFVAPYTRLKKTISAAIDGAPSVVLRKSFSFGLALVYFLILIWSIMSIANGTYNPFLYFKF